MVSMVSTGSQGQITAGPIDALVARTVDFIHASLVPWRQDPARPNAQSENPLNIHLCDFLDNRARSRFPMIRFSHQEPQAPRRNVDLSAKPTTKATTSDPSLNIYRPFLTIEGKRLPAPAAEREREYVTGDPECTGGIQRFKLGLHGGEHVDAVMVGYIQEQDCPHWFSQINEWISDIVHAGSTDGTVWTTDERLSDFQHNQTGRISTSRSKHIRSKNDSQDEISLHHLWIEMKRS